MTVEIICVGTEILLGNIVNTNAAFLAESCAKIGLLNYYQSVVGDNMERLMEATKQAIGRSDVVILSGGLGPTEDDLTKDAVANVIGRKLVCDEPSRKALEEFFKIRDKAPTENNWRQCQVIEGSEVVKNSNGLAPGMIVTEGNCKIILLPGPPNELVPMFTEEVVPYLSKLVPEKLVSQTVKIVGMGESRVETMLLDLIDAQTNPTIATYAKTGEVHVRVTAKADTEKEGKKLLKPVVKELKERFGNNIYTTEEDVTLEKSVVDLLIANDMTFSCAESCTGGMLSSRIINVPGVSEVYKQGFITYSNKAKRHQLGVKKSTLEKYGAVSKQTAEEMAKGLAEETKSDVSVAITGIAGPDGGTPEKPVGLVYISCYVKGKTKTQQYNFNGNRFKIRESATTAALVLARECVLAYFSEVIFGKKN